MRVVVLGSGGSWPTPLRNVPAVAVRMDSEVVLLDCGEGTQRQFMSSPLSFMDVSRILVTHFHGDHFLGIPGLLQSMSFNDRKRPVEVIGPEGIEELVGKLVGLGGFRAGFEVTTRSMRPGDVIDLGAYSIRAARALHVMPSLSYALEEKARPGKFDRPKAESLGLPPGPMYSSLQRGKTVMYKGKEFRPEMVMGPPRRGRKLVYSGDTLPTKELVELARDCDVLLHDGTVDSTLEEKANEYGHSSAKQAAEVAKLCNARFLIIVHVSPRYEEPDAIEQDAKRVFENAAVARDFYEYEVPLPD